MNKNILSSLSAFLSACAITFSAHAQTSPQATSPQTSPVPVQQAQPSAQSSARLADYIVAIVQREPLTYSQLRAHVLSLKQGYQGQEMPPEAYIEQQALKQLITQSALAQRAQEHGLKVEPQMLSQALSSVAQSNNLTVEGLRQMVEKNGIPFATLIHNIEQQLLIAQLRERTLDPTIMVSNTEVEDYLAQRAGAADASKLLINLAHILIAVPEGASDEQKQALHAKAQEVYAKAKAITKPEDFVALVQTYSDDPSKAESSGVIGAMPVSRYPDLFIEAVRGLSPGEIAPPVLSGAGYHIILVLDREQSEMVVTQTHARHILLTVTEKQTEQDAIDLLMEDKRKIETGQVAFEVLAREQSQDGSAKAGGDLGWVVAGMFVPEFENVMKQLKPGEISDPVVTRFGVHLIQVIERRESELTPAQQREVARESVHQNKVRLAYDQWVQEIESRAYVELREAP